MIWMLLVIGLALSTLGLFAVASGYGRGAVSPATSGAPSPAPATVGAQILFVRAVCGVVHLDCILQEPVEVAGRALPRGTPVAMRLALPEHPTLAPALVSVLDRWADEGRPVDVAVIEHGASRRVRLDAGRSTVQLDLRGAEL